MMSLISPGLWLSHLLISTFWLIVVVIIYGALTLALFNLIYASLNEHDRQLWWQRWRKINLFPRPRFGDVYKGFVGSVVTCLLLMFLFLADWISGEVWAVSLVLGQVLWCSILVETLHRRYVRSVYK